MELKEEKLLANEPQELLGGGPYWLVSWGSTLLLFVALCILGLSFYIKYPETAVGYASIIPAEKPVVVTSVHDDVVEQVLLKENALAKPGTCVLKTGSMRYLAGKTGRVHFLQRLTPGMALSSRQNLYTILPQRQVYTAQVVVNKFMAEKITLGQKVVIQLNTHRVLGYIDAIPYLPNQRGQLAAYTVRLHTQNINPLSVQQGPAEIVLKEMSLFSRIFQKNVK